MCEFQAITLFKRVSWKCREDLGPNYILLLVTSCANLMLIMLMPVHIWELILQQEANAIVCSITELQERIAVMELQISYTLVTSAGDKTL